MTKDTHFILGVEVLSELEIVGQKITLENVHRENIQNFTKEKIVHTTLQDRVNASKATGLQFGEHPSFEVKIFHEGLFDVFRIQIAKLAHLGNHLELQ